MKYPSLSCLIIRSPYIEKIVAGDKTWEIRGKPTNKRGRIGLIKGGSKTIVALADLVHVIGPLTVEDFRAAFVFHRDDVGDLLEPTKLPYTETYAWVLSNVVPLKAPVPYKHPSGAITWVNVNDVEAGA